MGFFSSSYVTTVATNASRVVDDNMIVPSTKQGAIAGLFDKTNSNQLVENILEHVINGLGVKTEAMYNYAKKSYTYGLPSSKLFTTADGQSVVMGVIKNTISTVAIKDYYHFGAINYLHLGWKTIVSNYGYNSITNELPTLTTAHAGCLTYLKDMVVVVRESAVASIDKESLEQWGISPAAGKTNKRTALNSILQGAVLTAHVKIDPRATSEHILVTFVWDVPVKTIEGKVTKIINGKEEIITPGVEITTLVAHEESIQIPIAGYLSTDDYFHVRYSVNGLDGYWLYKLGTGTYPEIETIFTADSTSLGSFFPIAYFKNGDGPDMMDKDETAAKYKTTKRLLKYLGMDYQAAIDEIAKNPDISKVEQALLCFGVPPDTTEHVDRKYLFDFFSKMYLASGGISIDPGWELGDITNKGNSGGRDHTIEDTPEEVALKQLLKLQENPKIALTIQDASLKTALSCRSIFKKTKAGVVAAVGKYFSDFTIEDITYTYSKIEYVPDGEETKQVSVDYTVTRPLDLYRYCHQITNSAYEEVKVYDLKLRYYMWGGYSTLGDDKSEILLVPLDHAITSKYSMIERELLYTRSMHFVFNSRVVTEVYWYQQAWFQFVIMVIAVVASIISMQPELTELAIQLIAVEAGTMTMVQFLIGIASGYLVPYLVTTYVIKLFVKAVGTDFAFLMALVLVAYTGFKSFTSGLAGSPWAEQLLSLGNGLVKGVNAAIRADMNDLLEEYNAFKTYLVDKTAELDKANDLLYEDVLLSPKWFIGQTPDQLYNTVHYGNIGMAGIDSVESYVDIALTLPTINNTLGAKNA